MIGWHTDNPLSKTVLGSIPGIELRHIREFNLCESRPDRAMFKPHIFYGILRGCGRAIHILNGMIDWYYIDNGYFDAEYVDADMRKDMSGKFRIVKNGMHEVFPREPKYSIGPIEKVLIIPPSPYSANFYDTTSEDWTASVVGVINQQSGISVPIVRIRTKQAKTSLEDDLKWCDAVVAFNSMAVLRATAMEIPAYDTHGIFRNFPKLWESCAVYDIKDLRAFYEPKQFTLEEIRRGKVEWN